VSSGSRLLFEDIVNDRVPLDWDGNARLRGDSLVRWLGDLRDRTNYLMTKCNDEKLGASRRLKGTTLLVPLRSLMRPKRYLSAFLLALAIHQPSVSLRDIYFCVQPLPLKDVRQPSPEFGIFVSGIIFRSDPFSVISINRPRDRSMSSQYVWIPAGAEFWIQPLAC
jgi:hypothetical protein